ncbi:MAG: PD-(D/E)XK nuclease family protein [Halobacteria archaeon]
MTERMTSRVSASRIKTYSRCPKQFCYAYNSDKEPTKQDSEFAELGTQVHEAIEDVLTQEDVPMKSKPILQDAIIERYKGLDEDTLPDRLYERGIKCCEAAAGYLYQRQPNIRDVERKTLFAIESADLNVEASAIIDVATENEIWDWKTGRIRDDISHDEKIQGSVYMGTYLEHYGEMPDAIRFVYLSPHASDEGGKVRTLEPSDEIWNYMISNAKELVYGRMNDEYPANPDDHCYFCPFEFWCDETPTGMGNVPWEEY